MFSAGGHVVAHEILKDDSDLRSIGLRGRTREGRRRPAESPLGRIVESRQQLHHRGLALAVFADQRDSFAGLHREIQVVQHSPRTARIGKRHIPEFESPANRTRRRNRVRLGDDVRLDREEIQQSVRNSAWSAMPENVENTALNIRARSGNRAGQERQLADASKLRPPCDKSRTHKSRNIRRVPSSVSNAPK